MYRKSWRRTKLPVILTEKADVYCFQETETPEKWFAKYESEFHSPIYINDNKNKGICVLARKNTCFETVKWSDLFTQCYYGEIRDKTMKYFLPFKINHKYTIVNCWCHKNNSEHFAYKGQLWKYLIENSHNVDINTVFIGDFNDNAIWDDEDCWWNMTNNNTTLNQHGLYSSYHLFSKESFGKESEPTFFLYRHEDRPYHIDYAYAAPQNQLNFKILNQDVFLKYSDHLPIMLEIKD